MNKKLLALAVASVLAAPGTALAQVTISGTWKVGIDQYKVGNAAPARTQSSEMRVTDNSSRLIFGVTEDLGGGLAAIGQWDVRAPMDSASGMNASGNTWVGLRSTSWGSLTLGRHDLHYGSQPDDIATKAGALMASSVSVMDYAAAGTTAIAVTSRTANVVRWDSVNWDGFTLTAAYSTSVAAYEADLTNGAAEKGSAFNLKGQYTASNWQLGASLWNSKTDGATSATVVEQDGQVFYGYYRIAGWKIGAAINQSEIKLGSTTVSDRRAWTIPVSYTMGAHNFYAHLTTADKDKASLLSGLDTSAKMMALAYVYDLSKRTSVGVTYAKITNKDFAAYNFFTNTGAPTPAAGGLGSTNATVGLGEDPQLIAFTVRHAF